MGKSNKKAKLDRINALRKRYDSFLEEDKKRRERNEYILGRLDKMRYSTALVPVRHTPVPLDNRAVVVNLGNNPDCSPIHDFQCITNQRQLFPDIQVKKSQDTLLIQELSKKYILIPKSKSSSIMDNYVQDLTPNKNTERVHELHPVRDTCLIKDMNLNNNENTDWKSKYEILNILKNEEKEKQAVKFDMRVENVSSNINQESLLRNNHNQVDINQSISDNMNTKVKAETANKYTTELPEKDLPGDTLSYELKNNNEHCSKDIIYANSIPDTKIYDDNDNSVNTIEDPTDDIAYNMQNVKIEYEHVEAMNTGPPEEITEPEYAANISAIDAKQSVDTYNKDTEREMDPAICNKKYMEEHKSSDSEQVVYLDQDEITPIQVAHHNELGNEMNNYLQQNVDVVKDVEFQELTPNTEVLMNTSVNINPDEQTEIQDNFETSYTHDQKGETVTEETENPGDLTGAIQDFDAEQKEIFYLEQPDENYTYQQSDVNAFNSEYAQNEYQQNQEYPYYEGTQLEGYAAEINNQEDVTERYDQNYENQYLNTDQDLKQQQYEQQPQQYQHPESYNQPQPEFEQLQYEPQNYDIQGQVQQVLDTEDGYNKQQQLAEFDSVRHAEEAVEQQQAEPDIKVESQDAEEIQVSEQVMG